MREALRQLESEELVKIVPKLGAEVRTLCFEEFCELLGYREAMELYAAESAARMRVTEDVEAMKEVLDAMRIHVNQLAGKESNMETLRAMSSLDIQFHRIILTAARNKLLRERVERVNLLQRLISPMLIEQWTEILEISQSSSMDVFEEHVAIYEAVRKQDPEQARASMSRHLKRLFTKLTRHLQSVNMNL